MQVARQVFYDPSTVMPKVQGKIKEAKRAGSRVDFVTFVADGEPALDLNLGKEIIALTAPSWQ
jgi:wyosine [tRNA(Phe)-imidazoG37] synthetase (radical SAM superfamily)